MASAAAPHYQLRLGNAAGSDFANEASIGMLSGWGDFLHLKKNIRGPSQLGRYKIVIKCDVIDGNDNII
jgi:hypothetical protein